MESDLIDAIKKYTQRKVSKSRFEHSLRTAETAVQMCRLYHVDEQRGFLAGIAHDMCKNMGDHQLLRTAARDGMPVEAVEKQKPPLLHGRAAAVKLREYFGLTDPDVLQAVAMHTFGGAGLCPLAKILYAADKIEPGRPQSTPEYRQKLFAMTLDELVYAVLRENIDYLKSKGKNAAPGTIIFYNELCGNLHIKEE
jgi:predicted HD superfamily hydrolase involved in NAD metabolism